MFSNEQILSALKASPPLVREAFGSDSTSSAISKLRSRYSLHIDTVGQINKEVGYMLLGFMDPMSFLESLVKKGISREMAKSIVSDLNNEIFLPLQKKMQEGFEPDEQEDEAVSPSDTRVIAHRSEPARAVISVPAVELGNSLSQPAVNLQFGQAIPQQIPHPWQTSPARTFQTASVPYTSMPQVSQPVPHTVDPSPVPQQINAPAPVAASVPQPPAGYVPPVAPPIPQAPHPMSGQYNLDPYREPIE